MSTPYIIKSNCYPPFYSVYYGAEFVREFGTEGEAVEYVLEHYKMEIGVSNDM